MIDNCKSCGASRPAASSNFSFICEYCGTKNVDDQYFIERAKSIDSNKANSCFHLGLVAFNAEDYTQADLQFQEAVKEDSQNTDAWIYLAHTKAKTLKPSNFEKNLSAAINCIQKAKQVDAHAEVVEFGSSAIANSFLAQAVAASKYYFDTAEKRFIAYGQGTSAVVDEVEKGYALINQAFSLSPTDSSLIAFASAYALAQTFRFDDEVRISSPVLKSSRSMYSEKLYGIYVKNKEVAENAIGSFKKYQNKIQYLMEKMSKASGASATATKVSEQTNQSYVGSSISTSGFDESKKKYIAIGVIATVLIGGGILYSNKNSTTSVKQMPSNVPTPSAPTNTQVEQTAGQQTQCFNIAECVQLSIAASAEGNLDVVRAIATQIDTFPKPDLGNKPVSRKLNTEGLDYFRQENYAQAINLFAQAASENPRDVEVIGNLGFAYLKAGKLNEAIKYLQQALILDPRRTSTWTPLAEAYALQNKSGEALAALSISYSWSSNREKSQKFYQDQVDKNQYTNPQIAKLYADMLKLISAGN
ncbi:tetratricopeptide (TPR) repeat protein [Polynucleobacter sphagniphilus]|uniref:tetratricopeptide repeat protein n=1 Tax=Polynucleobacter sphagniphilus TaxID=1743169 RepID=UPI002476DB3F|nr:tetratricopeptide repeat protein [Polynucleobacter sphagniphilus]MDH6154947.1 tetratricopeptide (TPR) repeat protein [Polynucleobacter sphagniphilus]